MRCLVTGSAGFIGFHLARRLLQDGHEVIGFDGLTPYYDVQLKEARHAALAQFPSFRPVIGQLEDLAALDAAEAHGPFDVIVHLAAQAGVRYSLDNPRAYVDSNLTGTFNLLEVARRAPPRHLLLASTSSVYGANARVPFRETDRADEPLTLYAASKKATEAMAHSYAHLHAIPTTAFRFFTVYGPWGRPDMALFKFVRAILDDAPIEIYGEGQMRRDFTYVDDIVEAILRLVSVVPGGATPALPMDVADSLSPVAPFRVVNIGGGAPVGLLDFVAVIERVLDRPARRILLPMQPGDVPQTFAAPDLLLALTGYRPSTPLVEGVGAFVEWFRDHRASAAR
ncbi:NAD-dependent epimerase/dehydratase family protein [Aurantimonas sp. MSK8Z-1]|uniref:NAD-dependent epimerase/dehydratase family protein n=1 Tax=Mangrovibrevibacter kandeliae TaxID=2968473 RepID=UPI002117EA14|nr:NAD-dependent epimerase/dehydratase family protein [Aurantimonas sp. MSK8Z-1]MCW4116972.1 NAD-dependent epimerase/dehydratase family protein [Aurantimonas sp. MSK8Z-1]